MRAAYLAWLALLLGLCATATAAAVPAEVRLRESGAGQYLTDARGMTLYVNAGDTTPGKSSCLAECAQHWPPLRAAASAVASGEWSLVEREDGAHQWAWRGQPLYGYDRDTTPGSRLGDGVRQMWRVALREIAVPPGFAIRSIHLGRILTHRSGRTLYWPRPGSDSGKSAGREWSPFVAPWMAQPRGDWTLIEREDGQKQWAFRGHPLFSHAADLDAADTAGLQPSTDWEVALLDPAPPLPAWVTVQNSDMGEVFADARGHTIYVLTSGLDKIRKLTCDDACIRRNWREIVVTNGAKPSGDWTFIDSVLGDAAQVWAYRGDPLFTHTRDREPGAIGGDRWASGGGNAGPGWQPVLRKRDLQD